MSNDNVLETIAATLEALACEPSTMDEIEHAATLYEHDEITLAQLLDDVNFHERYSAADERGEIALFVDEFARRNGLRMFYDSDNGEYFTF